MMLSWQLEHTIIRTTTTELLLLTFFFTSLQLNSIQMKTLALWMFGLLFGSLSGARGLNTFPENIVIVKNSSPQVTLTCATRNNVTWKFDDDEVQNNDPVGQVELDGPNLTLKNIEYAMLGEYQCFHGETLLSSTHLLMEATLQESESPINCRASSYDCKFQCEWIPHQYTAVRLRLDSECQDKNTCQWVNGTMKNGRLNFELLHSLSPYAEEQAKLEVTAEAINEHSFLRTTARFYLRDIVQPNPPNIVKCEVVEKLINVTIDPPANWSAPHSFFILENEIEYELKDNGERVTSSSALIPKDINKLRARSRDPLASPGSLWSEWSPWKNVTC